MKQQIRGLARVLGIERVRYKGRTLPAAHLRSGGPEFKDNEHFLDSARTEANRLVEHLGLTPESRVLEVGCGVGRLPIGMLDSPATSVEYWGLDVREGPISWCKRHIETPHPRFRFARIDVHNARYDPSGHPIGKDFRLPLTTGSFDIAYLYSVFSHMLANDVRAYLTEFDRLLTADGRIFFTGFIEEDVPDVSVNPSGYRMSWRGPLHCVRYERGFLERLASDAGFHVDRFDHESEANGQSGMYLSRQPDVRFKRKEGVS